MRPIRNIVGLFLGLVGYAMLGYATPTNQMEQAVAHEIAALQLPPALITNEGEPVSSAATWLARRRPELLESFRTNVYGRQPVGRPANLTFTMVSETNSMAGLAKAKQVTISYGNERGTGAIHLVLFIPMSRLPAPCFLLICNRGARNLDPTRQLPSAFWPAEALIRRGYAAAAFCNTDVAPDRSNGFTNGVYALYDPPAGHAPDAWGAIAAWAWGASRVMDYLATDPGIDPKRIAVVGHSRGGKAALWAGAEDDRFALIVSNDSGSTGAALARGKQGENIRAINRVFPHWFCRNYHHFAGRENELPVDQHLLAGLIAPRLLYIASATGDATSDPRSEFRTAVAVGSIYQLFGLGGLPATRFPAPDSPVIGGAIGYHIRSGNHDLTPYDWERFMDFADQHWSVSPVGH
ncbi:MAG TPA: acetylxylan esterase [Verrucomicrobiae bacterium]